MPPSHEVRRLQIKIKDAALGIGGLNRSLFRRRRGGGNRADRGFFRGSRRSGTRGRIGGATGKGSGKGNEQAGKKDVFHMDSRGKGRPLPCPVETCTADEWRGGGYWPDVVVVVLFLISDPDASPVVATCCTTTLEAIILPPSCV